MDFLKNIYNFFNFKFYKLSNLMPNFITKIFIVEFFTIFKVVEFEHEFEPGDLGMRMAFLVL